MERMPRKEFSNELLIRAREESFKENGIYSPISGMTAPADKERLAAFHNFFNERFKKMFAPLVDESLGGEISQEFLDKFTFCYWDSDEANACCWPRELPDGRIYVAITRGMIDLCETEGELMGIVGHEIGHRIHRLMKPYGNNELEEQGSDTIAMIHMPNAGYHPREMISIFEKMREKYPAPSNERHLDIRSIFDPHPEIHTRDNINKLFVQIDDHKYAHLTETPLDKKDIALGALVPMDHALKIDDDFIAQAGDGGPQVQADFKRILDDVEALQVSLVSEVPVTDYYMENIWNRIMAEYLEGKENDHGITLQNDETEAKSPFKIGVLNRVYWKKLRKLESISTPHDLLSPLWDKLGQTEHSETVASDLYKLECSMLNKFLRQEHMKFPIQEEFSFSSGVVIHNKLDEYFAYETQRQEYMPAEIIEARAYIKELLENPEKISLSIIPSEALFSSYESTLKKYMETLEPETDEDSQKNAKLKDLFSRLSDMVESGYLSHKNAGYLLNPVIEVKEGEPHPLYQVTHAPQKYTSDDFYESQLLNDVNPAKLLLATLGYYDSQTFPLHSDIHNLLTVSEWMNYSYSGLNNQDIQNMDEHSVFVVANGEDAITCEYNNKTGQITEIRPAKTSPIESEEIGVKCYNMRRRVYDGKSFSTVSDTLHQALGAPHAKLYEIKTRFLNTMMHYNLKALVQSFGEDNIPAEQVHDLVDFSKHYMRKVRERGGYSVSLRYGAPFVLEGMDWDYNIKNYTPADIVRDNENESKEYLFNFLGDNRRETYMNVAKGYIQLLERGLTDPEVAKQVIEASFYEKGYDGTLYPIRENPALFVLDSESGFLMDVPSEEKRPTWNMYVETHFRHRIFKALNQSPYLDEINELVEFKNNVSDGYGGVYEGSAVTIVEDIYEIAPALCAKVFALYEEDENGHRTYMDLPVKTFSDLQKMKDLYEKNKEKLSGGNREKLEILMKVAHDQYIEAGHVDVPVIFSTEIARHVICAYTSNVSRIENWPKSLKRSMEIMTQYAGKKTREGDIFQDVAPQSIIDDYQKMILSSPTFEAKLSVLSWAAQKQNTSSSDGWRLNDTVSHRLLDIDGEKTIWNNSIDENVRLYLWLKDRDAFYQNIGLQIKICKHLIDQLEQSPVEKQEEYSFLLLSKRADVPSPTNKQRLMEMWVKSVAELVGTSDDMSEEYLRKVQPYIHKLHNKRKQDSEKTKSDRRNRAGRHVQYQGQRNSKQNKRDKGISDYIYTQLAIDTKREL
ncbi:MAG: M48 family metallopeptidase, partial [Alphaproteobacteria bacterium]|nr:M48 family metallopeptidase [Alphaproteobacteria bacterium]